jgi:hypothetical protein
MVTQHTSFKNARWVFRSAMVEQEYMVTLRSVSENSKSSFEKTTLCDTTSHSYRVSAAPASEKVPTAAVPAVYTLGGRSGSPQLGGDAILAAGIGAAI